MLQKWLSLTVCMHSSRIYCKLLCRAFSLLPLSFPVVSPLTSSVPLCSFSSLISSVWFLSSLPVVGASLTGDQIFGCFYLYLNFIHVCVYVDVPSHSTCIEVQEQPGIHSYFTLCWSRITLVSVLLRTQCRLASLEPLGWFPSLPAILWCVRAVGSGWFTWVLAMELMLS